MESISSVRQAALLLRSKIDEQFSDLPAPRVIELALGERRLIVEGVEPADPVLAGGLGVLKRKFNTIFVSSALSKETKNEIIAHEIGHFVVHLESEVRTDENYANDESRDPLRRVDAYSKRERREAQANTFARELLFPRQLARRLFEEGKRAHAIARSLGLNRELVYQQLADALLLPEQPPKIETSQSASRGLNPSQERASDHLGTPFLLEAGPGTGKTKTLVERIVRLISKGLARPDEILALTFSNKAAEEIADRVESATGPAATNIWTGTFHAFGLEVLRKHHNIFGRGQNPRLVDTSEAISLLEDTLPALPIVHMQNLFEPALALRDILRAVSRAKDELVGSAEYMALAQSMLQSTKPTDTDRLIAAKKAQEVALVYEQYEAILAEQKAVDYGDLVMKPALMLAKDESFRQTISNSYKWVLVDEYQDINRASAMLVKGIAGDGERLWAVGDSRQSIYRFRGASTRNMARFGQDYPAGVRDKLETNYRSTKPILSLFQSFGNKMLVSSYALPLDLAPDRSGGVPPSYVVARDPNDEMGKLAASIRKLERDGVRLNQQAVIARTNGVLADVAEELEARGIPVLYLGPLFDRPEVRDLLSLLSLLVHDGSTLFRVGTFPEYKIPVPDLVRFLAAARSLDCKPLQLLRRVNEVSDISEAARDSFARLASHIEGFDAGTTPWLVLMEYLFERSGYMTSLLNGSGPADATRRVAVRQLVDALRTMPLTGSKSPIARGLQRVRHLVLLSDDRDLRKLPEELAQTDGVHLMTIHASKGLEFEAVHLPQLKRGTIPAANRPDACPPPEGLVADVVEVDAHLAEEECLFFVALSRAKTHLHLYRPATSSGKNSNPSTLLDKISIASSHLDETIERAIPRTPPRRINFPPPPMELTANDIESYESCGRQFYYDKIAELRGSLERGAYLRAHSCLSSVIRAAREARRPLSETEMRGVFETAWQASNIEGHVFEAAYRSLVEGMLQSLMPILAARGEPAGLSIDIGGRKVTATPDSIVTTAGGQVLTTIRRGKISSSEADKISHTIMLEAARLHFGHGFRLETFHLIGGEKNPIDQTDAKRRNRLETTAKALGSIHSGHFPPSPSDFSCPRCRYFFMCPAPDQNS
ncbi:UvrD-helicase domain-containing protein [Rhizobium johnstonii]|uniref:UvrD-helicase domain-containing protein n=1 Tax=Rhizobium johnstonii TaxID=3019933 RepID=UPI002DDCDCC3|nr:UvrD-helicase domain-containing protein [Rhizobium johnstonii]